MSCGEKTLDKIMYTIRTNDRPKEASSTWYTEIFTFFEHPRVHEQQRDETHEGHMSQPEGRVAAFVGEQQPLDAAEKHAKPTEEHRRQDHPQEGQLGRLQYLRMPVHDEHHREEQVEHEEDDGEGEEEGRHPHLFSKKYSTL